MSKQDDWFDDFMMMKMMEDDEDEEDDEYDELAPSEKSGCLPGILWIILICYCIVELIK